MRNMRLLFENDITAFVADNQFRKRDVRFESAQYYKKKRVENWRPQKGKRYFSADDFTYDERCGRLICPAGYAMKVKCPNLQSPGYTGIAYIGERKNCRNCSMRSRCIRKSTTTARQVVKIDGASDDNKISFIEQMKRIFDRPESQSIYSKRMFNGNCSVSYTISERFSDTKKHRNKGDDSYIDLPEQWLEDTEYVTFDCFEVF